MRRYGHGDLFVCGTTTRTDPIAVGPTIGSLDPQKKKKKQVKKPTAKTKMERVHEEDDAGEEESPDWQLLARFIKFVTRLPPYSTEV